MADVRQSLSDFDPLVAGWFERRFSVATEPQILGWPEIRAGRDVLISAPTGSGKDAGGVSDLHRFAGAQRRGKARCRTRPIGSTFRRSRR